MAHKILGIDLGSYSVKVAELDAGFRQAHLSGLYEMPLLPPNVEEGETETDLQRAARTLEELIATEHLQPEMCAASMRGEAVLRLLTMPFSDPKKIEQVLGYELESQILGDLSELVYDSVVAGTHQAPGGGAMTTNVIAVAAERAQVRLVIETLAQVHAEPRIIGAAALSYAALRAAGLQTHTEPQAVIDIGHRHTHVCIIRAGQVLYARSIARGGEEVTQAIADAFHLPFADAERTKHQRASMTGEAGMEERLRACVRDAVRPLVRELKQTIAAYRASGDGPPGRVLLTGGGARLSGMAEHLEVELGVPVASLTLDANDPFIRADLKAFEGATGPRLPAQALGLALAAAQPVPQANLRKGDLAYRTDYSYLRGKARYLGAATLAVLAFATVNAAASLRTLNKEQQALEARLKSETVALFGEARLDGKAISEELKQGPKGGMPPIPTLTAYDVLDEISHHVPPPDKGKLDITELDIKPKKAYLKATASSREYLEELEADLKQISCFEKVQKGKVSSVTAPPSGENTSGEKAEKVEQFTMNFETTCP